MKDALTRKIAEPHFFQPKKADDPLARAVLMLPMVG